MTCESFVVQDRLKCFLLLRLDGVPRPFQTSVSAAKLRSYLPDYFGAWPIATQHLFRIHSCV